MWTLRSAFLRDKPWRKRNKIIYDIMNYQAESIIGYFLFKSHPLKVNLDQRSWKCSPAQDPLRSPSLTTVCMTNPIITSISNAGPRPTPSRDIFSSASFTFEVLGSLDTKQLCKDICKWQSDSNANWQECLLSKEATNFYQGGNFFWLSPNTIRSRKLFGAIF